VSLKLCPRCGAPYSWIERRVVGKRVYYYAVHVYRDSSGKRTVKRCYLGPEEYEYVSMLHVKEGLTLKGLRDSQRAIGYLDALIGYLQTVELSDSLRRILGAKFMRLGRVLLGLEPVEGEVVEIVRSRTSLDYLEARAVEDPKTRRRAVELSLQPRERAEEVCRVLAEYGFGCDVKESKVYVYV